ncbi:MAG: DUF3791 domain-containing protein [Treponema sp.]|nr:DUF3791 domain-containing protein [Treponema sp.]
MLNDDLKHTEFVIYCIETYKGKKDLNGKAAYELFKNAGAIEYIDNNYGALHTFGDEHIVWNIDEYLKSRKY